MPVPPTPSWKGILHCMLKTESSRPCTKSLGRRIWQPLLLGRGRLCFRSMPSVPGSVLAPILPWQGKAKLSSGVPDKIPAQHGPTGAPKQEPVCWDMGLEAALAEGLLLPSLGGLILRSRLLALLLLTRQVPVLQALREGGVFV